MSISCSRFSRIIIELLMLSYRVILLATMLFSPEYFSLSILAPKAGLTKFQNEVETVLCLILFLSGIQT